MPFKRENYPADWKAISLRIRARAGQACECTGACGEHPRERCNAPNGARVHRDAHAPWQWSLCLGDDNDCAGCVFPGPARRVTLTVAHLDHDTTNNADANLAAMCQRCHLLLDRHQHARNAAETRRARKAVGNLRGIA